MRKEDGETCQEKKPDTEVKSLQTCLSFATKMLFFSVGDKSSQYRPPPQKKKRESTVKEFPSLLFFQRALGTDPSGILLLSHGNRGNFLALLGAFFKSGHQDSSLPLPARPPKLAPKKSTLLTDRKLTKKGCEIRIAVFSEVAHFCFYKYGLCDLWRISPLHTPPPPTQYVHYYITSAASSSSSGSL